METACIRGNHCEIVKNQDVIIKRCKEIYELYEAHIYHPHTIMTMFQQTLFPEAHIPAVVEPRKI